MSQKGLRRATADPQGQCDIGGIRKPRRAVPVWVNNAATSRFDVIGAASENAGDSSAQ